MADLRTRTAIGLLLMLAAPAGGAAENANLSLLPAASQTEVATQSSPSGLAVIPFVQTRHELRLTGEDDSRQLSYFLSPDQVRAGGKIRIAYNNAVSILPDDAVLDLEVNGHAAGSISIRSPDGVRIEDIAVPADMLKVGRNDLRLRARQHHRVDCSLAATYELWTQIDPQKSGFVSAAPIAFSTFDDLLSVGRKADGVTEIRLIAPAGQAEAVARRALPLVETLVLFLNRAEVRVSVGELPGGGPGIDVYAGEVQGMPQTDAARGILSSAPLGLSVRKGASSGRAAVVLRAADEQAVAAALAQAARGPMRDGLQQGVLDRSVGPISASTTETFSLGETDYRAESFSGRLFRTRFDIEMPGDFYPGDYGTVDFNLIAATAPGLAPGAQLILRVNDRAVTSHILYSEEGQRFDGRRIRLPLRAFHAGLNTVEVLAELPVVGDAACEPGQTGGAKPRFVLLEDSSFTIPALAHIGKSPDLAALAGTAYPFNDGKAFDLVVDRADEATIGSALTLVGRLSLTARKPLQAVLAVGEAEQASGRNALIVSTASVAAHKSARLGTPGDGPLIDPIETASVRPAAGDEGQLSGQSEALLSAFEASTALDDDQVSWRTKTLAFLSKASTVIGRWLKYQDPVEAPRTGGEKNVLLEVSQEPAPLGDGVWTTVSAATPEALETGMSKLTDPAIWQRLNGGSATLHGAGDDLVIRMPDAYVFAPIADTSFSNLRRLAAAWLSDNFKVYVGLVLALLGGFGFWLGMTIPRKGVRTDL